MIHFDYLIARHAVRYDNSDNVEIGDTWMTLDEVEIGDTWMKLDEAKEIPLIFLEVFNTSIKKFEQEGEFPPQQSDLTQL